jgi:hypothetical protein
VCHTSSTSLETIPSPECPAAINERYFRNSAIASSRTAGPWVAVAASVCEVGMQDATPSASATRHRSSQREPKAMPPDVMQMADLGLAHRKTARPRTLNRGCGAAIRASISSPPAQLLEELGQHQQKRRYCGDDAQPCCNMAVPLTPAAIGHGATFWVKREASCAVGRPRVKP